MRYNAQTNDTRDRITLSKDNSTLFRIPKRPKIQEAEHQDLRKFCVVPYRACKDKRITATMWRVLVAIAGYSNRSGISWVSQIRLGKDLSVSGVAIHYQLKKLKNLGYIEKIRNGREGFTADTLRIIYDSNLTSEDAIAIGGEPPPPLDRKALTMARIRRNSNKQQVMKESEKTDYVNKLVDCVDDPIERLRALYDAEGLPMPTGERLATELALMQRLS